MEWIELGTLLLILGFASLFRLIFFTSESSDEWVAFWVIDRQEHSSWITYTVEASLVEGTYGYPSLQHYLVSRFPRRFWGLAGRLSNVGYDVIVLVLVYLLTQVLASMLVDKPRIGGLSLPCAAALLFATAPTLFPTMARLATISGRTFGMLWSTTYLLVLGAAMAGHTWWLLLPAVLFGQLAIISSQFGLQVILFFSLVISVILPSPVPALTALAVVIIGLLLPKAGTREALLSTWNHKVWYLRNYRSATTAAGRNRPIDFLLLPWYAVTNIGRFIDLITWRLTPVIVLYSATAAWLVFASHVFGFPASPLLPSTAFVHYLAAVVSASVCLFILTSFPVLCSFGEAERYFEYSAFAFCSLCPFVILAWSEPHRSSIFWLLFLFQLTAVCFNYFFLHNATLRKSDARIPDRLEEAINWIRELSKPRILTVPNKLSFAIAPKLDAERSGNYFFYYNFIKQPNEHGFQSYQDDMGGLTKSFEGKWIRSIELPRRTPPEWAALYKLTHMLVDKIHLEGLRRTWGDEWVDFLAHPVAENESYALYEVCTQPCPNKTSGTR